MVHKQPLLYPSDFTMNFGILSLTALCSFVNFISATEVGDFVKITGLINKPEFNDSIGIVQKLGDERHQVLRADDECFRNFVRGMGSDNCMKSVLIKEANMVPVQWNKPEELSIEQILQNLSSTGALSSYASRKVTAEEREILDRVVLLIRLMCKDQPTELHKPELVEKLRLIGAWINQRFDHHAMVYVCEAHRPMKNDIECLWDRIGVWLR
jgi:hypothetical protein